MSIINKSLSELVGNGWKDKIPTKDDSYVIRNCYELYNKPLNEFETEDFRFMIGQKIGLEYTVPLAIDILRNDILAEGDFYEGDLLESVLRVGAEYWAKHPEYKEEVERLFIAHQKDFEELDTTEKIKTKIREAFEDFLLNK